MFCTSLRRRPAIASVIATLKVPPLSLRESQLNSHDVELSFGSSNDRNTGNAIEKRRLRVLLLSASDIEPLNATIERIQHFAALTGGSDLAIVFMLATPPPTGFISAGSLNAPQGDSDSSLSGIYAYTKLKAEMLHNSQITRVPILPATSIDAIPRLLEKHIASLKSTTPRPPPMAHSFDLLHLCTVEPMSQQTAFVLSDLFPNLSELAAACSSVTSAPTSSSPSARASGMEISTQSSNLDAGGKLKTLRDLVGDQACQYIVDFWKEEWTVD